LLPAVDAVPILAGRYGHIVHGEILIEFVKSGGKATAPCDNNASPHLHGLVEALPHLSAEKKPIQVRNQRPVGRGVIDRAADNNAVTFLEDGGG